MDSARRDESFFFAGKYGADMTRVLPAALLLILALGVPVTSHAAGYSVSTMGNGLTVIIAEDHNTDLVGIDVWVKAGSGYETPANNGVSHFIEHLIFGATAKRQSGDLDLEAESLGATLNAHTSKDWA